MSFDKILIFIPTYNDFKDLPEIVRKINQILPKSTLLIIDDGSEQRFRSSKISGVYKYFRVPNNIGIGFCFNIACDYALDHGFDILVRMDADNQHPVDQIPCLISTLAENTDLVIGSRLNHQSNKSLSQFFKNVIKFYYSIVTSAIAKVSISKDVNSGFMALNRTAILAINQFELDRYPEPQINLIASKSRLKIKEIWINQLHRAYGASTINLIEAIKMFYHFHIFILAILLRGTHHVQYDSVDC